MRPPLPLHPRPGRPLRRLIALLAFVWAAAAARQAHARATVTIELTPATGSVPTHVCVVTEARGARNDRPLSSVLARDTTGPSYPVLPAAWNQPDAAPPKACSPDPDADCRPVVDLPPGLSSLDDLFVACTADTLAAGTTNRDDPWVVFLLVEQLGASPPDVESVRLAGGIVTVGVGTTGPGTRFTVRSLGGHYLPHDRSYRETDGRDGGHTIPTLPLAPRCRWTEIALPRTRLTAADRERLQVAVHGAPIDTDRCVGVLRGEAMRVLVPRAPLSVGTIEVDLAATRDRPAARFGARWKGPFPPAPFDLEFRQVTFEWRRPACIYPADSCPRATLADGTVCAATVTDSGCAYTCPGTVTEATATALALPTEVEFEKTGPIQRWTDRLAQNGQTLSSYVDPRDVFLEVELAGWTDARPGNEVRKIKFFRPDGALTSFNVSRSTRMSINVPYASCASVPFEVEGDRGYREGRAAVRSGQLVLGRPAHLAKLVSFSLAASAGGGPAWSPLLDSGNAGPPVFFGGLLQFAINLRPRKPKYARMLVEMRMGVHLGQWGAVVFEDREGTVKESFEDFVWVRFLAGPGLVVDLTDRLALGVGVDFGASFPARRRQSLAGIAFTFITSPSLDLRLRVRKYLSIFVQSRGVVDKAFRSTTDTSTTPGEANGETTTARRTAGTLLTLFGLMAHF